MFIKGFDTYACDGDTITCAVEGFDITATIHHDDCSDTPDERDDGFWPSKDENAAGYVLPENFDTEQVKAEHVMEAWKNDEWWYVGITVTVRKNGVELTNEFEHAVWGIECNYPDGDNSYLMETANELIGEALEAAKTTIAKLCA